MSTEGIKHAVEAAGQVLEQTPAAERLAHPYGHFIRNTLPFCPSQTVLQPAAENDISNSSFYTMICVPDGDGTFW